MAQSVPRVSGIEKALLAALAAWGLFPLALLLIHAGQAHARFTGADGLIGADGVLGADQLQYLAWARDASAHGLASDLFSLAPSGHVYLEPIFTIIGGLHRIGLSLTLAYQLFKPVAIVALLRRHGRTPGIVSRGYGRDDDAVREVDVERRLIDIDLRFLDVEVAD